MRGPRPKRHIVTVLFLALAASQGLQAQDTLFYTNGKYFTGHVEEIGLDLVRYRTTSAGTSVLITAEKRELSRIKLEGGQEFVFNDVSTDVPLTDAFMSRKQVVSVDVLAPALNHATIGYERVIGPRVSFSSKLGYIGLGNYGPYQGSRDYHGGLIKLGVKFILPVSPKRNQTARDKHSLAGWYLRPELMFSAWTKRHVNYYNQNSYDQGMTVSSLALNLVVGRQVLLGERFTFDLYGGFGYGAQWFDGQPVNSLNDYSYNREEYAFSHAYLGYRTPLTVSGGMMFGYIF